MKYYFICSKRNELLSRHTMKEYSEFLEISLTYMCQLLKCKRYTTKHLAYAISKYGGKPWDYYFEGVE